MTALKLFIFFIFCLLGFSAWAAPTEIKDIRLGSFQNGVVRLVAETPKQADCRVFKLNNPPRLVVDFDNAKFHTEALKKNGAAVDFATMRLGAPTAKTCRIVLELPHDAVEESHFILPPEKGGNWRFVMDVSNNKPLEKTSVAGKKPVAATTPKTTAVSKTPRKKVIMLDPGHGGADPGAISRSGKYEKDLTLAMARELKSYLEGEGYKVVMTRDRDIAIPLRARIEKAHKADADLFISIHADSTTNRNAKGLSIYTISERASDNEAAALAERENKADIILGIDLGNYQPEVSNILIDLAKRDAMGKSAQYADFVVTEMRKQVKLVPNAHRFAGFVVLKSPNIPSVLLEMGYLSNRDEDKLMHQKSYRSKLAKSLAAAVNKYFSQISE